MELTLLEVGVQQIFPYLVQYLSNSFYVFFSFALHVNEDVVKIYNNKNIKLLCQNFVDVALEDDRYIGQSKKYHLIFEVAITSSKDGLLFVSFLDPHLMVDVG